MKNIIALILVSLYLSCQSGQSEKKQQGTVAIVDTHTSQNSLDWDGTYQAMLPCADCPGIKSTLTLKNDNTFKTEWEYLERNVKTVDSGSFNWVDGNNIKLNGKNSQETLQIGENRLLQLDSDGNPIEGALKEHYIYRKISN